MTTTLNKLANFGKNKTGLSTIGYTLYDTSGQVTTARTTSGVAEVGSGTGIYRANIAFPDNFSGSVLWDTGDGSSTLYATDEYNGVEADVNFIKAVNGGRWKLDPVTNEMIFYDSDNTTVIARFATYNESKTAAVVSVHQRLRNDAQANPATLIGQIDP